MSPLNAILARVRGIRSENENLKSDEYLEKITFKVNGEECTVGSEISSEVMLVDYIRNVLELRGTKFMCREAGCGACLVNVVTSAGDESFAVNSCLVPIMTCHGWEITTVEKIGNRKDGYHAIQKKIESLYATQCGHCTPGFVVAMYSLISGKSSMTKLEMEKSLCSNICRCTGYRPILDVAKSFASDATDRIVDIEDLHICDKSGKTCAKGSCLDKDWCVVEDTEESQNIKLTTADGKRWYVVNTIADVFTVILLEKNYEYKIVSGNSARAAFPFTDYPEVVIDISRVTDLKGYSLDQNMTVGAGITMTEFMDIMEKVSDEYEEFNYLKKLYNHMLLVAHIPVKNIGSLAGNLMIKYVNNDFQSDLFLILQTVNAQLTIMSINNESETVTLENFLKISMDEKLIVSITLPPLSETHLIEFYKIMARCQAVHAIVNAGFLYKASSPDYLVEEARIVYGALSASFTRAYETEEYLLGKALFTNDTLQGALKVLDEELVVEDNPPEPSSEFRKSLAMRLFYKGLLTLCPTPSIIHPRYLSGVTNLHDERPVSEGVQSYTTDTSRYPIGETIPKLEALMQSAGEAKYTEDLPKCPREVFAAFVLATIGSGEIDSIDPTTALEQPGVVAFFSAKDIDGKNSFTPCDDSLYQNDEVILSDGTIEYFNQPLGIIVAETKQIAERASLLVDVTYKNEKTPVIDLLVAKEDSTRCSLYLSADATDKGTDISKTITGTMQIYGQYHFPMETLVCVTIPTENGLEVHAATQWMSAMQTMISRALLIDESCIDVRVSRVGGSYGLKVSRATQVAIACSLVTKKLNRPCRIIQALTTNFKAVGKRFPFYAEYEVAVSETGVVQYANIDFYQDNGYMVDENIYGLSYDSINNCYPSAKVGYKCYTVTTNTPKNTFCRSPGTLEFIANTEFMMERIAHELDLDPLDVRCANIDTTNYGDLIDLIDALKSKANYTSRRQEVDAYNTANRWKKRGLRFSIMRWTPVAARTMSANISVFRSDGSVCIHHGGIEMGQGINTKAVQICAKLLGVPVETVKIACCDSLVTPNCFASGASVTSENVGRAVSLACETLLSNLESTRESLTDPTWKELIAEAYSDNVNLCAQSCFDTSNYETYDISGVCLAEVEIDVLTGELEILQLDVMEDVGASVNPGIDVGQMEGAIVMGLGYWTMERLVYDTTGEILTTRAWNYRVPQARDIPQRMNLHFKENSYGTTGNYGAKCIGEPPLCLAVAVPLAIREALFSARKESTSSTDWFDIAGPYTTDAIGLATCTTIEELKFY